MVAEWRRGGRGGCRGVGCWESRSVGVGGGLARFECVWGVCCVYGREGGCRYGHSEAEEEIFALERRVVEAKQ